MPSIEAPATPRQQQEDSLVLVSSALCPDGRSHTKTENAQARPSKLKKPPTSDIGLLSPTRSNQDIVNLLQQARRKCQADDFELEIVNWYTSVFSIKNIERVKQKILAT